MSKYRIFVEETTYSVQSKVIEADTLEEAIRLAGADTWDKEHGWEDEGVDNSRELRHDLSERVIED